MTPESSGQRAMASAGARLQDGSSHDAGQPDGAPARQAPIGGQGTEAVLREGTDGTALGQADAGQAYDSGERGETYQRQEQPYDSQEQPYDSQHQTDMGQTCQQHRYEIYEMTARIRVQAPPPGMGARGACTWSGAARSSPAAPLIPPPDPDHRPGLSEWAGQMLDINRKNIGLLQGDRAENARERGRLEKRLPTTGRLSMREGRIARERLDEKGYRDRRADGEKKHERRAQATAHVMRTGRLLFSGQGTEEDEDTAPIGHALKKSARMAGHRIRRDALALTDKGDIYRRLEHKDRKDRLIRKEGARLRHEQGRILAADRQMSEASRPLDKDAGRRAENREIQQRRRQKERIARRQGRISDAASRSRSRHQRHMRRASKKEQRIARKRAMTIIASIASIAGTVMMATLPIVLFLMTFLSIFAQTASQTVTQNSYAVLTDVTGYLREREAQLKDLVAGAGRPGLETDLDGECGAQTGRHVHEFVYSLPEFGFDDVTLMAYLSARFHEFDLQDVRSDLDDVFELMYQMQIELKMEERTSYGEDDTPYVQDVMVCYITVRKTELEEAIEARLDAEALDLYMSYKLSGGGQQVYGPVMDGIDWSGKISSAYGYRIHPITKEKKFHDGVDIAVPTGTELFSAVTGKVAVARYSDSAGNMVTVRTGSGWEVTYMHMDSISVSAGQAVIRGQRVGYSGNTGNSTGPHLHLMVHDEGGRSINPMFIVPQNGTVRMEDEER